LLIVFSILEGVNMCFFRGPIKFSSLVSITLLLAATRAQAAVKLWDNPDGGVFSTRENWSGGVPGLVDVARFGITDSSLRAYTVDFDTSPFNRQLVVDDNVNFVLFGHTYSLFSVTLGTVPNRSGNLTVTDGRLRLPSSASDLEIGKVADGSGVLTVGAGGEISGDPDVHVGLNGNGTLDINSGGDVVANLIKIGANSGSTGNAMVRGTGSTLFFSSLRVGDFGSGELNVASGGRIDGADAAIGQQAGSMGTANIDGISSMWDLSEFLFIGERGQGTLNITGGARVTSGRAVLAHVRGSVGTVNVDGAGSTWENSALRIGVFGNGTLNITGGAQVVTNDADIGGFEVSTAQVNVSSTIPGAASVWSLETLQIGTTDSTSASTGTVLIQAGGTVNVVDNIAVIRRGQLRLQGGTFSAPQLSASSAERFVWTAGTLRVGAYNSALTVPNGGILQPVRAPNGTTIQGDYNQQAAGATLTVEIGGPSQFTDFGVLTVEGTASLGGNLQITLTNGFIPTNVDSFDILRADGGLTGAFADVANGQRLMTSHGLGSFVVNYGPGSPFNPNLVILSAFAPGSVLPGDYDQNGVVDAADYVVWRNTLGQSGSGLGADGNGNGVIDAGDYHVWWAHFGQTTGSGSGVTAGLPGSVDAAVPEPASLALVCLFAVALLGFRRQVVFSSGLSARHAIEGA
jgi:T5SS/PEP-CTERM-associated repeat protein